MNALESQLHYPMGDALPTAGSTIEVAPGVRWIRMDLPFALNHINLWLLRDEIDGRQGWTIVDCGISNELTRANWELIFAGHLDGLPVLRVIVTHFHPDHIGLADWLTRRQPWRPFQVPGQSLQALDQAGGVPAGAAQALHITIKLIDQGGHGHAGAIALGFIQHQA